MSFITQLKGICLGTPIIKNNRIPKHNKGTPQYDSLYKCKKLMEIIMKRMSSNWRAGEKMCIDESVIKYNGFAID